MTNKVVLNILIGLGLLFSRAALAQTPAPTIQTIPSNKAEAGAHLPHNIPVWLDHALIHTSTSFPQSATDLKTPRAPIVGHILETTHSFGGSVSGVTGGGNRLYYTEGADLVVADVADARNPQVLDRWHNSV